MTLPELRPRHRSTRPFDEPIATRPNGMDFEKRRLVVPLGYAPTTMVPKSLFDAHTILMATLDNIPSALSVTEQTLVGRLTGGDISAVAIGIADNNIVQIDHASVADNDYAKFTAAGLEGRSYSEVLADLSGQAGATFDFNSQNLTGIGDATIGGAIITDGLTHLKNQAIDGGLSPMLLTGGVISEGTTGTVTISALTALLRDDTGATDSLTYVTLAEQANKTMAAANTKYHVVLDYNSGTPQILIQESPGNRTTQIGIGTCMKDASDNVHFQNGGMRLQDGVAKLQRRAATLRATELASGCTISDEGGGSRQFHIAPGVVYHGIHRLTPFSGGAFDSGTDKFTYIYGDTVTGFTYIADSTVINNTQYWHPTNHALATLTTNKYGCHWVYLHPDEEHVFVLMGTTDTKLAEAELTPAPSDTPIEISDFSVLLGCIIIKKDDTAFTTIQMVTDYFFSGTAVADHGALEGLADDDHPQYILHSLFDADTFLYASSDNTPAAISPANVLAALSGHAAASFAWNTQSLTGVKDIYLPTGDNDGAIFMGSSSDVIIRRAAANRMQVVGVGQETETDETQLTGQIEAHNIISNYAGYPNAAMMYDGAIASNSALATAEVTEKNADGVYINSSWWDSEAKLRDIRWRGAMQADGSCDFHIQYSDLYLPGAAPTTFADMLYLTQAGVLKPVSDIIMAAGKAIASGSTNGNTALIKANDTTFITLTTGATDVCTLDGVTLKGTLLADGTVTMPALTMGGDLELGANKVVFSTVALVANVGSERMLVRNNEDTAYRIIEAQGFRAHATTGFFFNVDAGQIDAKNTDANYAILRARDTGVGLVEVARLCGATDPYFSMGSGQEFKFTNGGLMGLFSATPVAQSAHIIDADGTLADITTKFNTLLANLEGYGLLAAS